MSKPLDPKNLPVPVDLAQIPAIPRPRNKFRALRRLAETGDRLIARQEELSQLRKQVRGHKSGSPLPNLPRAALNWYDTQEIAEFKELLELLDPEESYEDEDGNTYLKRKIISRRLGLLVGCKHIGQPTTPEAYVGMLLEHVAGMDPFSYLALDSACCELEAEKKYLPDISEVLEAIRGYDAIWERRKYAFWSIERAAADLADLIAKGDKQ